MRKVPGINVEIKGGDQVPETLGLFVEVVGKIGLTSFWHNGGI